MPINNLPAAIQSVIQQGYLEREFQTSLRAKLGFRAVAEWMDFPAEIGETITKTRPGLLPAITTPLPPAANSDITSGITGQNLNVEQFVLSVNQYAGNMYLNTVTSRVALGNLFLKYAFTLAEQAARSIDILAQQTLFQAYVGGNTRVRVTLGAAATTISVDNIEGFRTTLNSEGQPVPVSSSDPVNVTVGSDVYSLVGFSADSTNVSTTPGGISGTLTFSTAVTVADGTANNPVVSAVAPYIMRPTNSSGVMANNVTAISSSDLNNGKLTMQMILTAKAQLSANGVLPVMDAGGLYVLYVDPFQATGLYNDPAFQRYQETRTKDMEYRKGVIAEILGVKIVETNINPIQASLGAGPIHRGILCGEGALVEGGFTRTGYEGAEKAGPDDEAITIVDGIAHITREPLDALKQVVTQSWSYIGGFVVPTDTTTDPSTIPTATNAAHKRAMIIESL